MTTNFWPCRACPNYMAHMVQLYIYQSTSNSKKVVPQFPGMGFCFYSCSSMLINGRKKSTSNRISSNKQFPSSVLLQTTLLKMKINVQHNNKKPNLYDHMKSIWYCTIYGHANLLKCICVHGLVVDVRGSAVDSQSIQQSRSSTESRVHLDDQPSWDGGCYAQSSICFPLNFMGLVGDVQAVALDVMFCTALVTTKFDCATLQGLFYILFSFIGQQK